MSMFALYHNDPNPTPTGIDDALAGNLCRCTGYTPIAAASQRMYELADPAATASPTRGPPSPSG